MKVRQLMLIGIESSHPGLFLLLNSLVNPHTQSMHALCLNPLILRDLPRSYSPHIWPSWVGLQWNSALDSQGSYYDPQVRVDLIKSQQLILSMRDPNSTPLWWNKFVVFFCDGFSDDHVFGLQCFIQRIWTVSVLLVSIYIHCLSLM